MYDVGESFVASHRLTHAVLCPFSFWKGLSLLIKKTNSKHFDFSRPPEVETQCEPASSLLFLSEISNQCCPGYVRWCLTLLFF